MELKIITSSEVCIDFLSFFQLQGNHTLHVEFEELIPNASPPSDIENDYNWTSWLRMGSFSHIDKYLSNNYSLHEERFKANTFRLHSFLQKHKKLNYTEFKTLFFYKSANGKYVTENESDYKAKLIDLKINKDGWWLSVGVYYPENKVEHYLTEEYFQNSYRQLKIFYSSFIEKYHKSLLFLSPHYDFDAYWEREELEGRVYPDNYSPFNEQGHLDGWAELGREEERRMDEETDGYWRWNID